MPDASKPQPRTAAWYFVAATFLFVGSVFARTLPAQPMEWLATVAMVLGIVAVVVGAVVALREHRARTGARGPQREGPTQGGGASPSSPRADRP